LSLESLNAVTTEALQTALSGQVGQMVSFLMRPEHMLLVDLNDSFQSVMDG
jgi:hypothetical protein